MSFSVGSVLLLLLPLLFVAVNVVVFVLAVVNLFAFTYTPALVSTESELKIPNYALVSLS